MLVAVLADRCSVRGVAAGATTAAAVATAVSAPRWVTTGRATVATAPGRTTVAAAETTTATRATTTAATAAVHARKVGALGNNLRAGVSVTMLPMSSATFEPSNLTFKFLLLKTLSLSTNA